MIRSDGQGGRLTETAAPFRLAVPALMRIGAVAAAASVAGVVVAQFVIRSEPPEPGLEGLIAAYASPAVQARLVAILVQVMAMFVALFAAGVKLLERAAGLALLALAAAVFWQVFELVPRSVGLFAFALGHAEGYVAGTADAAFVETEFRSFLGWYDAFRSLRLILWSAAFVLLGLAAWPGGWLSRLLSVLFLLNGARVAALFALSMAGQPFPMGRIAFVAGVGSLFAVLAVWLWRQADEASHAAGSSAGRRGEATGAAGGA